MTTRIYPFIDIAVLDAVRTDFARGVAMIVVTSDLDQVLWANGPGAQMFGHDSIEAVIGSESGLSVQAKRQIKGLHGYPDIGQRRSLLTRLSSGFRSIAVTLMASTIRLPRGETAILLAAPDPANGTRKDGDVAASAISGFEQTDVYAALVDGEGRIQAASPGFERLEVAGDTLIDLIHEVRGEADRMVKRPVAAQGGLVPMGFARLTDTPAQHLLVAIDQQQATGDIAPAETGIAVEEAMHAPELAERSAEPEEEAVAPTAPEIAEPRKAGSDAPATGLYHDDAGTFAAAPVRFVWRTDPDGQFCALSDTFVSAVGEAAADIIGRKFSDVATVFNLDPDGEIAGLLDRRDTWSGRTVLWPVAGTDQKVPVDLAALPIYGRERSFEGFRGFGVARMNKAVRDPEAIGLSLVEGGQRSPARSFDDAIVEDQKPGAEDAGASAGANYRPTVEELLHEDDPFDGEVPALQFGKTPGRRATDKVIDLAERRGRPPEQDLTVTEKSAFREIGDQLRSAGLLPGADEDNPGEPDAIADSEADETTDTLSSEITEEPSADAWLGLDMPAPPAGTSDEAEPPAHSEIATASSAKREPNETHPATTTLDGDATPIRETLPITAARGTLDPAILARLPVPTIVTGEQGVLYASRDFLALTGYQSVAELEDAGGLDVVFADPSEVTMHEGHPKKQIFVRTRNGDIEPVEAHLQSIRWAGEAALLLALRRTTAEPEAPAETEPDDAEFDELRTHIEQLTAILDTATDGIVLINAEGDIRSLNGSAEALFGFETEEMDGQPFVHLFAKESQTTTADYLEGLAENGVASILNDGREVIGREAQGRFIPLFITIGRLPANSGFCAVLRDITHWKQVEGELTEARRQAEAASSQKTEFLARVSHEIRTPLNAIIGFSELMIGERFGPVSNDRYRDYLRDINRSGNHVLDLVNDLLDISKIEAGQEDLSYEAVSLNDALSEAVAFMQPQANRERVIIRSSFAPRLPDIVADLRSVKQIALNLLSNAVKFTRPGGQVIVSTAYGQNGEITMRVRDTGIGMSGPEIEQALKPFKQISTLHRSRGEGTGLGLPLTKAMVEANRARFSIESVPGDGTVVEVTFPSTRVLAD